MNSLVDKKTLLTNCHGVEKEKRRIPEASTFFKSSISAISPVLKALPTKSNRRPMSSKLNPYTVRNDQPCVSTLSLPNIKDMFINKILSCTTLAQDFSHYFRATYCEHPNPLSWFVLNFQHPTTGTWTSVWQEVQKLLHFPLGVVGGYWKKLENTTVSCLNCFVEQSFWSCRTQTGDVPCRYNYSELVSGTLGCINEHNTSSHRAPSQQKTWARLTFELCAWSCTFWCFWFTTTCQVLIDVHRYPMPKVIGDLGVPRAPSRPATSEGRFLGLLARCHPTVEGIVKNDV